MTATNPQPDDPRNTPEPAGPADVKKGLSRVLLAFVALVVVAAVAVGLSRCGSDDGPSGGEPDSAPVSTAAW